MKTWDVCTRCGRHSPYGCRTCPPPPRPVRLTERGRDLLAALQLTAALLLSIALVSAVNLWNPS